MPHATHRNTVNNFVKITRDLLDLLFLENSCGVCAAFAADRGQSILRPLWQSVEEHLLDEMLDMNSGGLSPPPETSQTISQEFTGHL